MLRIVTRSKKVSILFKDAAIEEVIKAVEAQSGYVVVYNNTLLKTVKRVTVTLRNVNAVEALNEALKEAVCIAS